ncbi:MAG TPA: glycosyltransferase family 2 protein [Chloroflexi bacterium]|nr:glycosyltransferase family 2 protein [Chloroflexota bacterium]
MRKELVMMSSPHVVIIVLNWNRKDDTLACLESLRQVTYPDFETVVVDNGSTDGSVPAIRARFPGQPVIETGENLGFAEGNNVGLRYARERGADYALLLNNDVEVAPDFLTRLIEVIDADPSIGVVGPMIYYFDLPDTIWSAGGHIDWARGRSSMIGVDERHNERSHITREVDFVSGCALLVRMSALEKAGDLDSRFFMYYEETEWCVRIRRAGYRIMHVPQAKIWHKIKPNARADSPLAHYYMTRNRLLFLKATGAGVRSWLYTLLCEYLRTLLSWTLRPKWRGKKPQRRMMLRAIEDALQGRWGQLSTSQVSKG